MNGGGVAEVDGARFVELEVLVCPGCGEPARGEPPAGLVLRGSVAEFSHLDGSALCPRADGTAADPVEQVGGGVA